MNREQQINAFFEQYETRFNESLSTGQAAAKDTAGAFTEWFIESSPVGVFCGKNGQEFISKVEQGFAFYRKIGTTGMNILKTEITLLDDFHAMCNVSWRYAAVKNGEEVAIPFNVIYLLQTMNNTVKIFAYIAGDEKRVLKEHGLI